MTRYVSLYCPYCKAKNVVLFEEDDVVNACEMCGDCGKVFYYDIEFRPFVKTFEEL